MGIKDQREGVVVLMGEQGEGKDMVGLHCNVSSLHNGRYQLIEGISEGTEVPSGKCFVWSAIRSDMQNTKAIFSSNGSVTISVDEKGLFAVTLDATCTLYGVTVVKEQGTLKGKVCGLTP